MALHASLARTGLLLIAMGALAACRATGADDLRGRELSVRARSQDVASDVAFWVNHEGRRLLVVVNRDRRSDAQRYVGIPAMHGIANLDPDIPVTVRGRVESLPRPEAMYSWNLTSADRAALRGETSYLRAETVTPQ